MVPKNRQTVGVEKTQRQKMIDYAREKIADGVKLYRIAEALGISDRELYRILNNK